MATQAQPPENRVDSAPLSSQLDLAAIGTRISTDRYRTAEWQEHEREKLWMRIWQIAGREEEIPEAGDWMEYRLFDQSFVLVRQRDGGVRGFVNACRHRGNAFCEGRGKAARFICPYHNWSYGLDGALLAVARPDFDGTLEEFVGPKEALGLHEVPVDTFGGFVFLNPDPDAEPLARFLGEAASILEPYQLEEMVAVGLDIREEIACNWKVVMDAFEEGYHVQGVHPQLAAMTNLGAERCLLLGDHAVTAVPFAAAMKGGQTPEQEIDAYLGLPVENFAGFAEALPRLAEIAEGYRQPDGALALPPGVTPIALFQQAVRETLEGKGLDVSGLSDSQMSDYQYWLLFPNVFLQVRAGDATAIIAEPDRNSDPDRCSWRVIALQWLAPEQRKAARTEVVEMPAGEHFPYFLALEQDFEQMAIQQLGLRNRLLDELVITRQEPKVAHFHAVLDRWLGQRA